MTTGLTEVGWLTGWRLIPVSTVNKFVSQFGEFTAATKKLAAEGIKLTGHQDAGLHAGLALGVCVVVGSGILTLGSLGHAHLTSRATRAAAKQAAQTAQAQKQAQEQRRSLQQIQQAQAQEQIQEQRRSLQQIQQAQEQIQQAQEQIREQLRQQLQLHAPAQTQDKVRRILQLSDEQQERLLKLVVEETPPASPPGVGPLGDNPAARGSDEARKSAEAG
jgi:flagellar biosynthesis GTPase FlhF